MNFSFSYSSEILSLLLVNFLATMTPGPDFALTVRNSLLYTRKTAVITALGTTCGVSFHFTYLNFGLGNLISASPWILTVIKIIGSGYLGYSGINTLWQSFNIKADNRIDYSNHQNGALPITYTKAFMNGFLTNLLNPQAILFFLSIFSYILSLGVPQWVQISCSIVIVLETFLWFITLALCFTYPKVNKFFMRYIPWVKRVTGSFLILIALKIMWDLI